ncbi:MerR family transcriptional regulator [Desulfosporosinus sp. OT]|uniref:MerR family transcriptional regulator n=1 Tax=Desulfosporosinus sp. OT TaxID=913865 RepID=UPI000223A6FF|nr:MerR family transcriptional regulator [Desulfosporosinus sp. OT]EGW40567.1 merR regulatory family protein [Desulfosporosinus sp. OT]
MLYTVNEVAHLTGVTVKTLYHYHKIGLLEPCEISDAGYRLYSMNELEQLQQILFFRELDFSLKDINKALEDEPSRLLCLTNQYELLIARRQRLDCMLKTLENSIALAKKGETMDKSAMFEGLNRDEWENALSEQNEYLKNKYGVDLLANKDIPVDDLNLKAMEAQQFLKNMSDALKNHWAVTDKKLHNLIDAHLKFLNNHGTTINAKSFVSQTKFFLQDEFHRNMLENQQPGLCYYLCIAAEEFAATK